MTDTTKTPIPFKKKRSPAILGIDLIIFAALVLFDQLTKSAAAGHLKGQPPKVLIPGVLELYYLENSGAAFGIFQNATWLFIIIATAAVIAIAVVLIKMPVNRIYRPLRILLVLVGAGAAGNLIDRFVLRYVRDFIYFSLIDFPIFNVADIYVTVSILLLILLILFHYTDEELSNVF